MCVKPCTSSLKFGVPVLGIIENMSYYVHPGSGERLQLFGEGGGKRLAEETDIPFLGQIPVDPLLSTCGDEGRSLFAARSVAGDAFISLAKDVAAHTDRLKTDSENCLDNFELIWKEMATR
jgi:ATP-binding protein involved in chromosome partitioning